jgi:hypothetical protein
VNGFQNPCKSGGAKKLARSLLTIQPLLAVERLVANNGVVAAPVKAVSRRPMPG